jgi:hypothetical protein
MRGHRQIQKDGYDIIKKAELSQMLCDRLRNDIR